MECVLSKCMLKPETSMWWDLEVGCLGGKWVTGVKPSWVGRRDHCFLPREDTKDSHVQRRKYALTKQRICQCLELGFQSSELWGLNFYDLSYQSAVFCYSSPNWQRQLYYFWSSIMFSRVDIEWSDYLPWSLCKRANSRLFWCNKKEKLNPLINVFDLQSDLKS